jgi:NAD(P)H dehydrogenase (quinone)
MNILVVFSHPMRNSFTGNVLDSFVSGLQESGHQVEIADLYREGFQPIMQEADYAQFYDQAMPKDVLREQARFERCDAFALVFPIWWWSFPAMLKGWIERVFSAGWAFKLTDDPEGSMLESRKALILCCAGGSSAMFEKYGTDDALEKMITTGVMEYCGVDDVRLEILHQARTAVELNEKAENIRKQHLKTVRKMGKEYFGRVA